MNRRIEETAIHDRSFVEVFASNKRLAYKFTIPFRVDAYFRLQHPNPSIFPR
jgi:hypothetical protein